jgi:hypothetical protein
LLQRSHVLLNIHQGDQQYFEWLRVVQAMLNGCVVVSEHSSDFAPLEPGRHLLLGRPETLGLLAQRLLDEGDELQAMAREAYLFLTSELPMSRSVAELVEVASDVDRRTAVAADAGRHRWRHFDPRVTSAIAEELPGPPSSTDDLNVSAVRGALKDIRLEQLELRRDLRRHELERATGRPLPRAELGALSRSYHGARPRVSVITALYNHAEHVRGALDSLAETRLIDIEAIVVDDGSSDGSGEAVREWIERRPGLPAVLVRHPVNRGLPNARNTGIEFARGEYVFILDADNQVMPQAIARLAATLDEHADVAFAYCISQLFDWEGPRGLVSFFPWQPERLRQGNYIDAMALLRRDVVRSLGGYDTDRRMHGWEDYELWCRMAESGHRGLLVPEILCRYRHSRHSMLSLSNLAVTTPFSILVERYPRLMAGVTVPL